MMAVLLGLMGGLTVGVCSAPLWMMLQLPMRLTDILDIKANMRLCAVALTIGATLGTLHFSGFLPEFVAMAAMALGGLFVGMLASALAEAVEVVPVFFDRLSVTTDMRYAAAAMAIGKTAGVILFGIMNG